MQINNCVYCLKMSMKHVKIDIDYRGDIMQTRMERFHGGDMEDNERIKKNKRLYDTIYQLDPLNDTLDDVMKANEMEVSNIPTNIRTREEYHQLKEYRTLLPKDDNLPNDDEKISSSEDKIYDINSVLAKAKMERKPDDEKEKYHKLVNTQYDILNNLNVASKVDIDDEKIASDEEKLRELINTITMNKRLLNDLGQKEDTGQLLTDLLPGEDTLASGEITETSKEEDSDDTDTDIEVDKSFYTSSSLSITKDDFNEDVKELENAVKTTNILIKVLLFILIVIVTTIVLFVLNNYVDLNLFKK